MLYIREERKPDMRIICSWCLREGKIGLIGEKFPLDDLRETHSICNVHYQEIEIRWEKRVRAAGGITRHRSLVGKKPLKKRRSS